MPAPTAPPLPVELESDDACKVVVRLVVFRGMQKTIGRLGRGRP